jgi:hypothetical protein
MVAAIGLRTVALQLALDSSEKVRLAQYCFSAPVLLIFAGAMAN